MEDLQSELYENDLWYSKVQPEFKTEISEEAPGSKKRSVVDIQPLSTKNRKSSFVWKYFRALPNSTAFECIICNGCVSNQTSNLARHLLVSHNITQLSFAGVEQKKKGRLSRSFIWKYCTKENALHARCHLCKKLLYFGGGNTTNISKHLWRKHANIISHIENRTSNSIMNEDDKFSDTIGSERKTRKGGSYVWKYTEKLSRHTVRCKLCQKVMSFHGTANVITHLQRKHNIIGKSNLKSSHDSINENGAGNESNTSENFADNIELPIGEPFVDSEDTTKRRKRSVESSSIVWKYCKRIGRDVVRCSICNKNLSNQGTSNLQRHLHRMHGVVMQSRFRKLKDDIKQEETSKSFIIENNNDFIYQFCTLIDDEHLKCNMCSIVFGKSEIDVINKHLTGTHSIKPRKSTRQVNTTHSYAETESSEDDDDSFSRGNYNKNNTDCQLIDYEESSIKKDFELYDGVEYEPGQDTNMFETEKPFELSQSNPLSPHSSQGVFHSYNDSRRTEGFVSKKLQKLNEDRIRMEIEYLREKAAFYRMQKYLTALQAKKVRAELEEINKKQHQQNTHLSNSIMIDASNSTAVNYAARMDSNEKP